MQSDAVPNRVFYSGLARRFTQSTVPSQDGTSAADADTEFVCAVTFVTATDPTAPAETFVD